MRKDEGRISSCLKKKRRREAPLYDAGLPEAYGENVLRLMVQDPGAVFAYWELSPGHRQAAGEKTLVLCLYKNHFLERKVSLPPLTDNWYFRDVEPGSGYYCELGFEGAGGTFFPLLRSNHVDTPFLVPPEEDRPVPPEAEPEAVPAGPPEENLKTGDLFGTMAFYMGIYRAK
jgi:hypothetical protein